jgi:hypothetical protein
MLVGFLLWSTIDVNNASEDKNGLCRSLQPDLRLTKLSFRRCRASLMRSGVRLLGIFIAANDNDATPQIDCGSGLSRLSPKAFYGQVAGRGNRAGRRAAQSEGHQFNRLTWIKSARDHPSMLLVGF